MGKIEKRCLECKETKPISEFHKDSTKKDGLQIYCKSCQRIYQQSEKGKAAYKRYAQTKKGKVAHHKANLRHEKTEKYKISHNRSAKRYRIRNPQQIKAKRAVEKAIRVGKLPRPDSLPCHYCPAQAKEYHHHLGYEPEHWLDVIPVCLECHIKCKRKTA